MADHQPHITLPECPACNAPQKAVANWERMEWYCFNCGSSGDWELHVEVTDDRTPEAPPQPQQAEPQGGA